MEAEMYNFFIGCNYEVNVLYLFFKFFGVESESHFEKWKLSQSWKR